MEQISDSENVAIDDVSLQEDLKESGTNEEFWPQDEEESRFVDRIKERLDTLRNGDSHAIIFRVPQWVKEQNRHLYEPKMVSIGPYYRGRHELFVQDEKWSSLRDFLSRNEYIPIDSYVRAIGELKSTARRCYFERLDLDDDEFVEMLLLDGCFILEFFLKNDPGQFDPRWDTNTIVSDLFLLENQIPFFVLHKLHVIFGGCHQDCSGNETCPLVNQIIRFLPHNIIKNTLLSTMTGARSGIHHLIHLLYMISLPNTNMAQRNLDNNLVPDTVHKKLNGFEELEHVKADIWAKTMPSATDLQKAGVTFRRKRNPRNFFDITFKGGIMEMPFFIVGGASTTILMNMIAFEQMQPPGSEKIFTSYVVLKDSLINTGEDIDLLEKSGVLANLFDNKEKAADVFNDLGNHAILEYDNHYYADLFREIRRFSNSTWHSYRARLFRDFSTNPWTLISVVTGAIALILTFIQTYYAGIQTYAAKP